MRASLRNRRLAGDLLGAVLALAVAAAPGSARAQTSASYDMKAHVVNEGGHPAQGAVLTSGGFRMTLDAVGQGLFATAMGSASFSMGVGFVAPYPAPGEVAGVRVLADRKTLLWTPEPAADHYNVYRDLFKTLPGLYGLCWASPLPAATVVDNAVPGTGSAGFFYLVTAENALGEEGTKGFNSAGAERGNLAPCP